MLRNIILPRPVEKLEPVLVRAERALASLERTNVSRLGKMGISAQGHAACVTLTPNDLRALLELGRLVVNHTEEKAIEE